MAMMDCIKCGVVLVSRFYVSKFEPFRVLYDVGIVALLAFIVFVLKDPNMLTA